MDNRTLKLILGLPIEYQGVKFYPPTVLKIAKIGADEFDKMFVPFTLTSDCFSGKSISVFTAILHIPELLNDFLAAMKLVTKYDSYRMYDNRMELFIHEDSTKLIVDSKNYDYIADIMLAVSKKERYKAESAPVCNSKRAQESWAKLQAGRKRVAEKNRVYIYDIINVCLYGGNYPIPLSEIKNMTLWQLMNCYEAKIDTKNYNDNLSIALVSGDSKSISDNNHWHKRLMIRE